MCADESGINALATVRSLGRRGVVDLQSSPQVASASRYCRRFTAVPDLATLPRALLELGAGAVLYVDNDPR